MTERQDKKLLFAWDDEFQFSCHKGLACYNSCCRDINIFLTPYDVLRMRRATGLPSEEFLQKYTDKYLGEEGLPLVVLKLNEDAGKTCPFVSPDGCSIYQDRPWSCRMYPVFPTSAEEEEFLIEGKSDCHGFREDNRSTVREWKRDQGIDIYDKMNDGYKKITRHDFFQNGNTLTSVQPRVVYMACYDLDAFKKFLFGTKFFQIYDVEQEVVEKMRNDDEELLSFGYLWVRFNLFSEATIRVKDKDMDKLMQSRKE